MTGKGTSAGYAERRIRKTLAKLPAFEVYRDSRGRFRVRWFRTDLRIGGVAGGLDAATVKAELARFLAEEAKNR